MTAAITREVHALSTLLRSLSVRNLCADVVHTRQRNVSTVSLQQKSKFLSLVKPLCAETTTPLQQKVVCTGIAACVNNGACLQHRRTYAKGRTPRKKPLTFDYSGDLVTQKPLNPQDIQIDFRDFADLDGASESIQKLCSVDFASGKERKIHRKEEMRERILKLFGNQADREMHVAMLTVEIRNMIPHILPFGKDKLNKSRLIEKIQLRKKMLKHLRKTDYERFMWLLKELGIRYVLPPMYSGRVTKKYGQKKVVWEAANQLRLKKIAELRTQLEAEKADFLKYKEEKLKEIEEDAKKYNLDLASFEKKLERQRIGKTYPRIYTWEERQQMEKESAV